MGRRAILQLKRVENTKESLKDFHLLFFSPLILTDSFDTRMKEKMESAIQSLEACYESLVDMHGEGVLDGFTPARLSAIFMGNPGISCKC